MMNSQICLKYDYQRLKSTDYNLTEQLAIDIELI